MSQVTQAAPFKPLPASNIQANMGPQFGPTATPNPYVAGNTPAWATGNFAMPWWGLDPFGQPLTQEQMMYQAPPPPPVPEPAAPSGPSQADLMGMMDAYFMTNNPFTTNRLSQQMNDALVQGGVLQSSGGLFPRYRSGDSQADFTDWQAGRWGD
jgi:hypothetical protein